MARKLILFLFLSLVTFTLPAQAFVFDANVFYFTDETDGEEKTSNAVTAYAFFIGFSLDKKGRYLAGWNYATYATTDEGPSLKDEYSSTQMGPAFIAFLDRNRTWRVGFAYNLSTTAEFKQESAQEEEWRGTGMAFDFGYQLYISELSSLGIRLNYTSTDFDESVLDTTKEDVSYSKVMIYPSLALTLDF